MFYTVEVKTGVNHGVNMPSTNAKWAVPADATYKTLPVPYRYKLQRYLGYSYGKVLAKTIMAYVKDYLRQDYEIYAWWFWGRHTVIICKNSKRYFRLSIQPTKLQAPQPNDLLKRKRP